MLPVAPNQLDSLAWCYSPACRNHDDEPWVFSTGAKTQPDSVSRLTNSQAWAKGEEYSVKSRPRRTLAPYGSCGTSPCTVQMSSNVFIAPRRSRVMKRFAFVLSLIIGAWLVGPTPEAQAWSRSGWSNSGHDGRSTGGRSHHGRRRHHRHNGDKGSKTGVPELDPNAAGGAIVLLLGGVAYVASRRREEELV
jgi:hypothetical protein